MRLLSKWTEIEFSEILTRKPAYGANSPAVPFIPGQTPRLIRITDIDPSGRLLDEPKVGIAPAAAVGCEVNEGDILIARTGATVGKSVRIGSLTYSASFAGYLIRFVVDESKALRRFITQYLNSPQYWQWVGTMQRAGAQPNINSQEYCSLVIQLPSLPEQAKIADILGVWDEALEKLDALIAAKERRKQALMQQLLSGKRRSGGKPWKRVLLADVAEECGERNGKTLDRSRLFAVTKAAGMVPMRENVQGATINRCKLVEPGWFAYNPMRINIGSIARWEGAAPVMVSPDYVVFRAKEDRLLSDYLNHVRQASPWADFVGAAGNGSVRVRIWFDDLGRFKLPLPPLPEQRAIADILDTADTELRLLRRQRAALDRQKRGLMQQLLTGRIRVRA